MKDSSEELAPEAARLFEALLAERRPDDPPPAPSRLPLSAAQRRLWELGRLTAGSAWGNLPLVFRVRGPFDADAMESALAALLERHESLRMRFEEAGGEVFGRIVPMEGRVLEVAPRPGGVEPEEAR
ncbi:MAG: condensation domain-containing protein, partial [Gemmatimonadota bacterium]|nr:condensation domain-containing protein [Gemmatimonadota bacterium]